MKNHYLEDLEGIPGFSDVAEEKMLFQKTESLNLSTNDVVIEIGTLFGRTTSIIAQGLRSNPKYKCNILYAYDSFVCDITSSSANNMLVLAKKGNVVDYIKVIRRVRGKVYKMLDYENVFKHYLKTYDNLCTIKTAKTELTDINPYFSGSIALIRFNISKNYEESKLALFRFLPKTRINTIVIFSDFFNQWSAALVLTVAILVDRGCFTINSSAGSSLICNVIKPADDSDFIYLDLIMQDPDKCINFFESAIKFCKEIKLDQPENQLPKITLAKIQWLYSKERFSGARDTMVEFFKNGKNASLVETLLPPYLDLLGNGFSVTQMYKADKKISIDF